MNNIPYDLEAQITHLTSMIRNLDELSTCGIKYYKRFIFANIEGVIKQSFPYFFSCVKDDIMVKLIENFILHHHSFEPEFHQIATEFVLFVQKKCQDTLKNILIVILEYEWSLFYAEINPAFVELSNQHSLGLNNINNFRIFINPTVHIIQLPFLVPNHTEQLYNIFLMSFCPIEYGEFFYVIFRNSNHNVLIQELTIFQKYILDYVNHSKTDGVTFHELLDLLSLTTSSNILYQQLYYFYNVNLIIIK